MKTKTLIILIVVIGLGIGGFFVWKNTSGPEEKKKEIEQEEISSIVEEKEEEKKEEIIPKEEGPKEVSNTTRKGTIFEDETWGGTIHVTGDIDVMEGAILTILPGTIIKIALTDDQNKGSDEPITDIYFPKDPPFYEKQKITITIRGILNAVGTPDNKIIFTSVSENPTTYDWRGIDIFHGRLEHAIVEYGQGNIQIQHSSDVILANNIIRNSLTCCICIGHSNQVSPQILNNDVYNCGHETIDYAGGSALIKGNYFHLENPEIQPDPSRCGGGIIVYKNTYPTIEDNVFEKLSNAITFLDNSLHEAEEGKKVIFRNNEIKNNQIGIRINPGYPEDVIAEENNQLINNEDDRLHL